MSSLLLAYDDSPAADRALEHAANLAKHGDELIVINVIPVQSISARLETVTESERARQTSILLRAEALLAREGIEVRTIEAVGDPCTEILAAAEAAKVGTIVVGRGGRGHLLRGSVSGRLVRAARCDVLVVHEPATRRASRSGTNV